MPKKTNKAISNDHAFVRARARISASGNIRRGLAKFKVTSNSDELRGLLPLLINHPAYRSLLGPAPKPMAYNFLGGSGLAFAASLENELIWSVQYLLHHASLIERFLVHKVEYEDAFLRGNAEHAADLLNIIENEFGVSLWLVEARINFLQTFKGFDEQREFADSVAVTNGVQPLIRFLVSWISSRSGQNIAPVEFYNLLDEVVPLEDGFGCLTHIFLGHCRLPASREIQVTLAYTDIFPPIDRYLLTIAVCQAYVATADLNDPNISIFRTELPFLESKLSDPSLVRLMIGLRAIPTRQLEGSLIPLFDSYFSGNYEQAMKDAYSSLARSYSIEALYVLLKAASRVQADISTFVHESANNMIKSITEDLSKLIMFSNDAHEASVRLSKIVLTNTNSGWAATLSMIIARYQHDERLYGPNHQQIFSALRARHENPILGFSLEPLGAHRDYLALLEKANDQSCCLLVAAAVLSNEGWSGPILTLFPSRRLAKYEALAKLRQGRSEEARRQLDSLYINSSDSRIDRCEVGSVLVEALLQCRELLRCSEVCSDLFQLSSSFAQFLPLRRLLREVVETSQKRNVVDPKFCGSLSLVLLFDIFSRFVSSEYDAERADAFKDFLIAHNILFASDLVNTPDLFPRDQLVQFLKYICIPEVLDQSLALGSTRAVEDERAKILVLLSELTALEGKPPPAELLEELSTIKTRQVVRETTLRLDQSKVYVNVDGIKKSVGASMREMWRRYKLLTAQQRLTNVEELQRLLESALGERVAILSLSLPLTEANKLFIRILHELREMFSVSKEFGLDVNLSTNIRHGFVMREIRGPLLARHLVTNKISADGSYQRNVYWLDRLSDCYNFELEEIGAALSRFSERVDAQIEYLNRSLIRIRSEQAPEGLFNFVVDDMTAQLIQRRCDKAEDYDDFIDTILEFLWGVTNSGLESLRSMLLSTTLTNLQSAIDELQSVLHKFESHEEIPALISVTNLVRPDLRSAVERVASWFTLSRNEEYQDYDFRISYEAGLATVKSYYSHWNIASEFVADSTIMMNGRTLPSFVRLFSILMDNSAFHSVLTGGSLKLLGEARCADGVLYVSIRNNLAETVDLEHVRRQIANINSEFGRERASELIPREGGSGYPKIWKILTHDVGGHHALQVSLTESNDFFVEMMIDARGIVL